jgi:pimeloyl-ACP methyl ester carboxylesterase
MTRTSRRASATLSPQVDDRVIDGPGHFLMLEKPEEFNAAVLDFLRKNNLLGG